MKCGSCSGINTSSSSFSGDCGAPLTLDCPACGSRSPANKKFCSECGAALSPAGGARQGNGPNAPRRPAEAKAERRQLTVMFCDLVGSTALSARVDPEVLRELIGAFDTCVAAVIGRYDGTVARYLGDCVLAYFGYPTAHEDDAERAVRAGLELTDAVAHIQTGIDAALEVRVGIATGMVVVGDLIGEGAAQERAVFGET